MNFYKLSNLTYKGRKFTAFVGEYGGITFLEMINNKYHYVDAQTYAYLLYDITKYKKLYYKRSSKSTKYKFVPKIIVKTAAGLALVSMITSLSACGLSGSPNKYSSDYSYSQEVVTEDGENVEVKLFPNNFMDSNEIIETDDYEVYEVSKSVYILTTKGINLYYDETYTFDMCFDAINNNSNIPDNYKEYLINFVTNLQNKYPNVDLTCLYNNLSKLKVLECDDGGLINHLGTSNVEAAFSAQDGALYINKNMESVNAFEYILYHEIGHMMNNLYDEMNGYEVRRDFSTYSEYGYFLEESFNTIFTEDLMGITIDSPAYQLTVNYTKILMDETGYSIEDYLNGNHLEFENLISSKLPDNMDAYEISYLMQLEWHDVRSNQNNYENHVDYEELSRLQDIVSTLYFNNHINNNMSDEEIINVYDELITKITYNVYSYYDDYTFDFSQIEDTLFRVLEEKGITNVPSRSSLNSSLTVTTYENTQKNHAM